MAVVRWLHISDLHLNRRGIESRRIRNQLLDFLKCQKVYCKYIFITGDLRYGPEGEFGESTVNYLMDIKDALGVDISNVLIVPGNHDVKRDEKERMDAIHKVLNKGYYNSKEGIIKDSELKGISSGKAEFAEVMDSFYKSVPERIQKYRNPTDPHFLEITDDFNVIHLDATLTYSGEHERDLLLCTEKLLDVLEKCDPDKLNVVLSHYSFDFLSRDEQKAVENLIRENGVGLWLSGHEHNLLIRTQRDCFYDIQSGNLNYEEGDIKSCVLVGEMDTVTKHGEIWGYEWDTDIGWKEIQIIDKKNGSSRYEIDLNKVLVTSAFSAGIRNKPYAFETYLPADEAIPGMSISESNLLRGKMGADLDMEPWQIDANKDSEPFKVTMVPWNDGNGLSILLGEGEYAVYQGFLYLDFGFTPFMEVTTRHTRYYGFDHFEIENDTVRFDVNKLGDMYVYITFQYNLSRFKDVDERLLHFRKIKRIQAANSLFVKMRDHEEYNIKLDKIKETKDWEENVELTNYWIDQMERIATIERHFDIKFSLPIKATEDDYLAIDVLSDSIDGLANRVLSPIPMEHPGISRSFELEEEVQIGEGDRLLWLRLFGYDFKPVAQYMLPGKYVWRREAKAWEAEKHRGGVPVRVEFEVSRFYENINSMVLTETVPFADYEEDFCLDDIIELEGENEEFFERYIRLTYDVQANYKLFCDYRNALSILTDEAGDGMDADSEKLKNPTLSTVLINRITERVVSAGSRFTKGMSACVNYLGIDKQFTMEKYYGDNIGFMWLTCMQAYTQEGHFPISIRNGHNAEYDFQQIRNEAKVAGDNQFVEVIDIVIETAGKSTEHITSWYNMIRNYCYTVAVMQRDYYNLIEPVLKDDVERMKDFIRMNPGLVHKGKNFDNCVTYLLKNDKRNLHLFSLDDDPLSVFYNYKDEATKHLKYQMIGLENVSEVWTEG